MHAYRGAVQDGAVTGARDDHVLQRRQLGEQRGEERQQGAVDEDDLVVGVLDDPDQLLGGEPEVQGVEDGAHRRDGEVRLHVFRVVPHEGRDPLVPVDAELVMQGVGELGGS